MKTYNHLYEQITSFPNLWWAWKKARRGKRVSASAAAFEQNLETELFTLRRELLDGSYQPGAYRSFTVHDPKRRKISAAPFRDRVVHHALIRVIEPIYDRKFVFDSYANRVGKGSHRALDRCTEFSRRFRYVMPCDVQQFFPAIDHAVLKQMLARTIACKPTMALCERIIDSGAGVLNGEYTPRQFPGDDLFAANRPRGLPIGNLTSQFWANVYLNDLDQFVKHTLRVKGYIRYVDDFLLFAHDKAALNEWRDAITNYLQSLRLTIHERRTQAHPVKDGMPFLGFIVFPDHRRLKRRKGIRYRRFLTGLYRAYQQGEIPRAKLDASVQAWVGHVMHGDTWGLRTAMFAPLVL